MATSSNNNRSTQSLLGSTLLFLLGIVCSVLLSTSFGAPHEYVSQNTFVQAQSMSCVRHAFTCCRIVNYPVMGMLANQWDAQTCTMIDFMLKGKLANYSSQCKQAFIDSYCLSTIAQCCPNQPVSIY